MQNEDFICASANNIVVCDGHNGPDIAKELCACVFDFLERNVGSITDAIKIQECVDLFEEDQYADVLVRKSIIGSTLATVTLESNENKLILSWIGDSQIILKLNNGVSFYETRKHLITPGQSLPDSIHPDSIINERLGGVLRLSRAVCDYPLKQMGLTAQCDSEVFDTENV